MKPLVGHLEVSNIWFIFVCMKYAHRAGFRDGLVSIIDFEFTKNFDAVAFDGVV